MRLEDWGLIHYEAAERRQYEMVEAVAAGDEERLIVCRHPAVVTLGRSAHAEDLIGWSGETYQSSRGGRATYHGPSQTVIYPILDLRQDRPTMRARDVHAYLRTLESTTVTALAELGLKQAEARTTQMGEISLTGVWVGEKKIASIGIAVRKWITYHGVAVNVVNDSHAFQGIKPCGFNASVMTSVENELGSVDHTKVQAALVKTFLNSKLSRS